MSTLTATLLKKMLATAESDCTKKPLNYTPPKPPPYVRLSRFPKIYK